MRHHFIWISTKFNFLFCKVEYSILLVNSVCGENYFRWGVGSIVASGITSTSSFQSAPEYYIQTYTVYFCFNLSDTALIKKVCFHRQKFTFFPEWATYRKIKIQGKVIVCFLFFLIAGSQSTQLSKLQTVGIQTFSKWLNKQEQEVLSFNSLTDF